MVTRSLDSFFSMHPVVVFSGYAACNRPKISVPSLSITPYLSTGTIGKCLKDSMIKSVRSAWKKQRRTCF